MTKSGGALWDVGDDEGFGAPDVTLSLVAPDFDIVARSTIVQDEYYPRWNEAFPPVQAASLPSLVAEVADADVLFNDPIGFCWLRQGVSGFSQGLQALVCDPAELKVTVDVTIGL